MTRSISLALTAALSLVLLAGCGGPRPALTLTAHSLARSAGNCTGDWHDCTWITLTWPETHGGPVADSVNAWIGSRIRAGGTDSGAVVHTAPESVAVRFLDSWREFHARWPDSPQQWTLERRATVILDSLGVVSVRFEENSYTGGAHGMHTVQYASFAVPGGRRLKLADLVVAPRDTGLAALGEREFRAARRIGNEHTLADEGFFGEGGGRFRLSDDLAVTRDGLTFQWDEYEIAPYAWGPTTLTLPWTDLRPYLRRDGPLALWAR
ncbi:MAG: DUF3298 domain-containing protein [Candidatus Eisenbacteria bacterium]